MVIILQQWLIQGFPKLISGEKPRISQPSTVVSDDFPGFPIWFAYDFPGFPMIFLWFSYDFPMIFQVFLWFSSDFPGFPMIFLWFSYDLPPLRQLELEDLSIWVENTETTRLGARSQRLHRTSCCDNAVGGSWLGTRRQEYIKISMAWLIMDIIRYMRYIYLYLFIYLFIYLFSHLFIYLYLCILFMHL